MAEDLVSDYLVFYALEKGNNRRPLLPQNESGVKAHLSYWNNSHFFRDFLEEFGIVPRPDVQSNQIIREK